MTRSGGQAFLAVRRVAVFFAGAAFLAVVVRADAAALAGVAFLAVALVAVVLVTVALVAAALVAAALRAVAVAGAALVAAAVLRVVVRAAGAVFTAAARAGVVAFVAAFLVAVVRGVVALVAAAVLVAAALVAAAVLVAAALVAAVLVARLGARPSCVAAVLVRRSSWPPCAPAPPSWRWWWSRPAARLPAAARAPAAVVLGSWRGSATTSERGAGLELRDRGLLDLHGLAGARVTAGAGGAGGLLEGAEAGDADLAAPGHLADDDVEDGLQRLCSSLLAAEAPFERFDQISLVHGFPLQRKESPGRARRVALSGWRPT